MLYLLLLRSTELGAGKMLTWAASGAEGYREGIANAGGEVKEFWALTGGYDAAAVVDFPDDVSCLAVSLSSELDGFYCEALRAYSTEELDQARGKIPYFEQLAQDAQAEQEGKVA
jgi:uncharacterized protein with GYD domain